jgi:hypothetical protein
MGVFVICPLTRHENAALFGGKKFWPPRCTNSKLQHFFSRTHNLFFSLTKRHWIIAINFHTFFDALICIFPKFDQIMYLTNLYIRNSLFEFAISGFFRYDSVRLSFPICPDFLILKLRNPDWFLGQSFCLAMFGIDRVYAFQMYQGIVR